MLCYSPFDVEVSEEKLYGIYLIPIACSMQQIFSKDKSTLSDTKLQEALW